ncbi:hypothetical protein HanRHA438_Chr05g0228361 [Helianthus annuus]|uniref:Uncharacterized protein n=1 Tax=Helianthus annuus TaxID=4232 RepID=A0A9K3NN08_HELAN|nr:hypothetical protein HanXRQr2_Chr05g0219381 [Helianthus annuus]KAJ0919327.1 hypothetical protein HanRHA438_Chr05g0228361 [Helianthus annuus]
MTNTTPRGSGTISAEEGKVPRLVFACKELSTNVHNVTFFFHFKPTWKALCSIRIVNTVTFSGFIQSFSFFSATLHELFIIAICIKKQQI